MDAGPSDQERFSGACLEAFVWLAQQMTASARDGREGFKVAHESGQLRCCCLGDVLVEPKI